MRPRLFTLAALLLFTAPVGVIRPARAQDAPAGTIGRVEGPDISVESGSPAGLGASASSPGIYVVNGSVVTVHSGQARMTLASGGQLGICGPAKFTVLESGSGITLALSFGRIHVEIPAAAGGPATAALRIFTPAVIATPLGIGSGARDITVGLDLDTSLCVRAASGAIQLEQQFTGEKLIAPEAGDFFLTSGKFAPVASAPGGCACSIPEPETIPSPPAPEQSPSAKPLEHASVAPRHPAQPAQVDSPAVTAATAAAPDLSAATSANVLPGLVFDASAPWPRLGPDVVLLARRARVEPDWEFAGHIAVPELQPARQSAKNARGSATIANANDGSVPASDAAAAKSGESGAIALTDGGNTSGLAKNNPRKKKSGGFWASLKRLF